MNIKLISAALIAMTLLVLTGCEQKQAEKAGEKIDNVVSDGKSNVENALDKAGNTIEEAGDKIQKNTP